MVGTLVIGVEYLLFSTERLADEIEARLASAILVAAFVFSSTVLRFNEALVSFFFASSAMLAFCCADDAFVAELKVEGESDRWRR